MTWEYPLYFCSKASNESPVSPRVSSHSVIRGVTTILGKDKPGGTSSAAVALHVDTLEPADCSLNGLMEDDAGGDSMDGHES